MKIVNEKLKVKLDIELSAHVITELFFIHYASDCTSEYDIDLLCEIATRLNKTEVLNIIKQTMKRNIFSSYDNELSYYLQARGHRANDLEFGVVFEIIKRKFDGIK